MGLRDRLLTLLAKGDEIETDPDEWCELVTIPQFEAPLLANRLEATGIEAMQQEAFNPVTKSLSGMRFLVRRSDLPAAHEVV